MTKETLSDEEISHPLNEPLLKEAGEIKAERQLLRERLEKLEQNRGKASLSVYQKVRTDYAEKLNATTERLLALKKDLEKEETALAEKKNLVEANITRHKETIEESELRHSLGEYTPEQHQAVTKKENKEVARLESALKTLNEAIERHQKIFEGEEFLQGKPVRPVKPAPPPTPPPPPSPPPLPKTEEAALAETGEHTAKVKMKPEVAPEAPPEPVVSKKIAELLVMENGKVVQNVPIDKTIQIGRSPANDVVLKEAKVSRKHAEIQFIAGKYILLDLESSNGTFVAGKKITEYTLQPNDEIVIGNTKMVFKL